MIPITFAITAADWSEDQAMLRMMLTCLSNQTVKDFDVVIADHHYQARKTAVKELASIHQLDVKHMPLIPAPHLAKRYIDCSVFNAGWLMSEAERCVRFSEWRCITPDFVESVLKTDANHVIDFYFHDVGSHNPPLVDRIWDRESGSVAWGKMPDFGLPHTNPGPMENNCYGNYALSRENWMEVNGFNEVSYSFYHWEDLDFNARCMHSGYYGERIPQKMFRFYHPYGKAPNRGNRDPELPMPELCSECDTLISYGAYNLGPATHQQWTTLFDVHPKTVRVGQGHIQWNVCKICNFIIPAVDTEDIWEFVNRNLNYKRAPINIAGAGRNMRRLSDDLKGKSWADKIKIYENSWTHKKYLLEDVCNGWG